MFVFVKKYGFFIVISLMLFAAFCLQSFAVPNGQSADETSTFVVVGDAIWRQLFSQSGEWMAHSMSPVPLEELNTLSLSAESFSIYNSNIVIQRFFLVALMTWTPLSRTACYKLAIIVNCLFSAISFGVLFNWLRRKLSTLSATIAAICFCFSPLFMAFVHNLYWAPWNLLLPMVVVILLLRYKHRLSSKQWRILLAFGIFLSCLVKQFVYFELVTTSMIALTVPLLMDFAESGQSFTIKKLWGILWVPIAAALASFVVANLIKLMFLSFQYGSFSQGAELLFSALRIRILGIIPAGPNAEILTQAADASPARLILELLFYTWIRFNIPFPNKSVLFFEINLMMLLCILLAMTIWAHYLWRKKRIDRHTCHFLLLTWYSLLAPISWFILAKPHAYIHPYQVSLGWFTPFVPLATGVIIQLLMPMGRPRGSIDVQNNITSNSPAA